MERKHLIRLPPCPDYDIAGTETWLADMAREGWLLGESGFFCGLAFFDRAEPREMTYRLSAALRPTGAYSENGGFPDEGEQELNTTFGWDYVGNRGQFHIYRTPGRVERELHTDPAVQALAVEAVRKRQRKSALHGLAWLILFPLICFRSLVLLLIFLGLGLCFLWTACYLVNAAGSLWRVFYYGRLKRRLEAGEELEHQKDWRRERRFYRVRQGGRWLLLALAIGGTLLTFHRSNKSELPTAEFTGAVPFATLADLAGGEVRDYETVPGAHDRGYCWTSSLGSTVEWDETAAMTGADGTPYSGRLYVLYHEAAFEWLAKGLAENYRYWQNNWLRREKAEELPLPDLGLDEARAYLWENPTVVLRQGNKVLRASYREIGPEESRLTLEEWAGILAGSIR